MFFFVINVKFGDMLEKVVLKNEDIYFVSVLDVIF